MAGGWVKFHNKILDWRWYTDANTFRLFFHLIVTANYKDKSWKNIVIRRGQRVASYDSLAKELQLSQRQIRTALKHLKATGEVTSEVTSEYSILTVVNYGIYQDRYSNGPAEEECEVTSQVTSQVTSERQASDKRATTTTEEKKERSKDSLSQRLAEEVVQWLGSTMPPLMVSDVEDLIGSGQADEDLVLEAIRISKGKGKRSWPYAHGVLKGMIQDGYTTGAAYRGAQRPARSRTVNERGIDASGKYREQVDWNEHFVTIED